MTKALLDSNILIDYLSGIQEAKAEIALYNSPIISVITRIEVLVGARSSAESKAIRGFLSGFQTIELSAKIADHAVILRQQHRLKIPNAIVYASAKVEGTILVTRNTKDFDRDWPDIREPYIL